MTIIFGLIALHPMKAAVLVYVTTCRCSTGRQDDVAGDARG
jgi:hypothetical protein